MRPSDIDFEGPEWEELDTLFGGYLHQDMDVVHGGPWPAVQEFRSESTAAQREQCAQAIRHLLTLFDDEENLVQALRRLGLEYYPTNDGYRSYRAWLTTVADYLERPDPDEEPGPGRT